MAESYENGQSSNSHVERIREEVNKLLPDINFDDDDEEDDGPVEIFSRGRYISDLEVYDFEEEDEEEEKVDEEEKEVMQEGEQEEEEQQQPEEDQEQQQQQQEEVPSLPLSLLSSLRGLSNGFGGADSRSESSDQGDSLVSLMQRALRQLSDAGANSNPLSQSEPSTTSSQPSVSAVQRTQGEVIVTSRGDGVTSQGQMRASDRQPVLFGGLTAAEHDQARDKYLGDRKVTLKFGQRGDVDLDELLRNVPTPDVDISHYYDVEIEEESDNGKSSALIQKLEEMSKKYAAVSKRGTQPWRNSAASVSSAQNSTASGSSAQNSTASGGSPPGSTSSILKRAASSSSEPNRANQPARRVEFCASTDDPAKVIDFAPSRTSHSIGIGTETRNMGCSTASIEAFLDPPGNARGPALTQDPLGNERPTVVLDLRPPPPPPPQEDEEEDEDEDEDERPLPPLIYGESSESSGEEEEEEDGGGLWLDRFRRAKAKDASEKRQAWTEESTALAKPPAAADPPQQARQRSNASPAEVQPVPKTAATRTAEADEGVVTVDRPGVAAAQQAPVSERVQQKIAEIKRKEEELRKRRQVGQRIAEQLPKDLVGEQTPLIFHEEESFADAVPLLPEEALPVVTLRFEQRAPGEVVTFGKRVRPIDDGRAVSGSLAALLSWFLSLASDGSSPFRLLGLQQSASQRCTRIETHVALHLRGPQALPQLQRCLASSSLADLCPWVPKEAALSSQKLSTFLTFTEGFEWRRSDAHLAWGVLRSDERLSGWPAAAPELQTSVLRIDAELFPESGRLFRLLVRTQRSGLDLAGCRLLQTSCGPFLALAFRGPRAVSALCSLCGPGVGAELSGAPAGSWHVARFPEAVPRLLARWFGGRALPTGLPSSLSGLRHCLTASEPSDLLLLASPAIPEASWLLRAAMEAGMEAVGVRRVRVDRARAQAVLGMTDAQAAVFAGAGCCHLLVLRRENAMGHAAAFVESAFGQLKEGQQQKGGMPPSSLLLYVMPCLPALLTCLGGANLAHLPPISPLPRPPISEEEPSVFVVSQGQDCRRLMLEVLDQTTDAELLAIKLLPRLPAAHNALLGEVLGQRLTSAVCCALLRGQKLQDVLVPVMRHSSGKVLFAKSCADSIRLANAFFHDTEVIGDPRRRQLQSYLPEAFLQHEGSVLANLCRELPELLVPFSVIWEPSADRLWVVRRLWKWLESENFRVSSCSLDSEFSASFLVLRSNALFRLHNGLLSYLSSLLPSARLSLPPDAVQLPSAAPPLPKVEHFGPDGGSWPSEVNLQETALLIVSSTALQGGGRSRSGLHLLMELLSGKKLQLLACRSVELNAEAAAEVEKFGDHQSPTTTPPSALGPALALLLFGPMARLGMRQLLRSKPNVAKMAGHVFVPQTQNETLRMASQLFCFVVPDAAICAQ